MAANTEMNGVPKQKSRSPWFWVPSLYYAEGIPYIVAMTVSVIFYKRMGISNAAIALYTSWLYLPWVIKPLWSPVVEIFKTKRFWIVLMEFVIGGSLAAVALTIPIPNYFQITLAIFWLLAFSSATHDIAADGFYMLGLTQHQQAWFVGVRSTFYRFAMLTGQGLLVILAGWVESHSGLPPVELPVTTVQQAEHRLQIMPPDSLQLHTQTGDLRIITVPEMLVIPLVQRDAKEVQELVAKARNWNAAMGQKTEEQRLNLKSKQKKTVSLWNSIVVKPIQKAFLATFGPAKRQSTGISKAGNVGVVFFHLSKSPASGQKVVVTFGRESGDKSISLVEGARFEFTAENWHKPVMSVIQIDPKLRQVTTAKFVARAGNVPLSWILTFVLLTVLFVIFAVYHRFILPKTAEDVVRKPQSLKKFFADFANTFVIYFKKEHIGISLTFLLFYRLAESQLVKLASPFLLDSQEMGGMALTTGQLGFIYGTIGLIMLTAGGLLGGFMVARDGLKKWIWLMVCAINIPDLVYVYMAHFQPDNYFIINLCVGVEQLGYGFGFTSYMLYMIYISEGNYKTAHFAISTGFMALGMMIPGMMSGWIQELIGYQNFFIWILFCTIPGFIIVKFLPLDPEFGKKKE